MATEESRWSDGGDRELTQLLSLQFESLGDARPTEARVFEGDDTLRFTFIWPLAAWEAVLAGSGQGGRLERFRLELLEAMAPSLAEVVEAETGREARSLRSGLEADRRHVTVSFALGATTYGESREAIRNWSAQVRRNARRQRAEHRKRVEELKRTARSLQRIGGRGQTL